MGSMVTLIIYAALFYYGGLLITGALTLPLWTATLIPPAIMTLQYAFFPALLERILSPVEWDPALAEVPEFRSLLHDALAKKGLPGPSIGLISSPLPILLAYGSGNKGRKIIISSAFPGILSNEEKERILARAMEPMAFHHAVIMRCTALFPVALYYLAERVLLFGRLMKNLRKTRTLSICGLALFSVARWSFLFLYFATREWTRSADRAFLGSPANRDGFAGAMENYERQLVVAFSRLEEPEERFLAAGFLSMLDPRAAYERSLPPYSADQRDEGEQRHPPDLNNPWRDFFELFSSHPDFDRRVARVRHLQKSEARDEATGAEKPSGSFDLLLYFLPHLSVLAGFLLFTVRVGSLGVPFLFCGIALLFRLLVQYRSIPKHISENGISRPRLSGVASLPIRFSGRICFERRLAFNPYLLMAKSPTLEIPCMLKSPYPVEAIMEDEWEGEEVEITGWERRAPWLFIEVQHMRQGKKLLYRSYVPLALGLLSGSSIIFGLFIILLQIKGG
jgi:Zn-dependent protease with chaperone function